MVDNQYKNIELTDLLPQIREFLDSLIKDAGLENADAVLKEMMLADLSDRLNKMLFMAFAKELSEKELDVFARLVGTDNAQALAYLQDVKPEMPRLVLQTLAEFRAIFLEQEKI